MKKIRTGDEVLVMSGRNKGQRGKVRVNLISEDRVIIEGVNIVKKHIKRGRARQAGIVEVEAPLHVSKVRLISPFDRLPTKVGIRQTEDGKNERYDKRTGQTIPNPVIE